MKSTTDFLRELSWLLRGQILCLSYLTVPQPKTFKDRTVPATYNHGILAYVRGFLTESFTSVKKSFEKNRSCTHSKTTTSYQSEKKYLVSAVED